MKMKQLIHQIKPTCASCPYKLGQVQTLTNPCPQCKENSYQTYELFQQEMYSNDRQPRQECEQNGTLS